LSSLTRQLLTWGNCTLSGLVSASRRLMRQRTAEIS
jgi:hypothetical protein